MFLPPAAFPTRSCRYIPLAPVQGQKFVLGDRPQRTAARGVVPLTAEEQAAERARRRQSAADGDGDAAALPALI